jgi:hypothetical protein
MVVGIAVFGSITAALAGRLIQAGAADADTAEAQERVLQLEAMVDRLSTALAQLNAGSGDDLPRAKAGPMRSDG